MSSKMDRRLSKELLEIKSELINMKDLTSVDDFSYDKVNIIRGDTPHDINQKCLKLCQDYLADIWTKQTTDTIQVKRLTGGMTNQLYYCGLSDPHSANGVPHEVAIRLYGPKHFNNEDVSNERLTDLVIALMVSEMKLGPQIYGIFEEGQIQSYLKHRHFRFDEQRNPKLADELFRKLARVHAMDVPIKKNTNWLFENFDSFYEIAFKRFDIKRMIKEQNLVTYQKYDIKKELEWLKKTIIAVKSPIMFTHIDFRGTNIMVTEPNDELILCDFEYSSYGYRGFDFGTAMVEWNRKVDELFKAKDQLEKYPDDQQIRSILKPYLDESQKILGKSYSNNKINSMDQLVKEAKVFSMVADMFIALSSLKFDEKEDGIPFDKRVLMEMGERNYMGYWQLKTKFMQDNLFEE